MIPGCRKIMGRLGGLCRNSRSALVGVDIADVLGILVNFIVRGSSSAFIIFSATVSGLMIGCGRRVVDCRCLGRTAERSTTFFRSNLGRHMQGSFGMRCTQHTCGSVKFAPSAVSASGLCGLMAILLRTIVGKDNCFRCGMRTGRSSKGGHPGGCLGTTR